MMEKMTGGMQMRGTIKYVTEDEQYHFRGAISGEDGRTYKFNSGSWLNKTLTLNDLCEGQAVEFELKAPNQYGYVFPRMIRFLGETPEFLAPGGFPQVSHSHGRFNDFVYVKTDAILMALEQLVPDFADSDCTTASALYKKLALHFNGLQDGDFIFSQEEPASVMFPSGFCTADGTPILLNCTENRGNSSPWFAAEVAVNGKVLRSLFGTVNANWYNVEQDINELAPENRDTTMEIIRNIEKRCFDAENSLLYLNKGTECAGDCADELYAPTGYFEPGGKEIYLLCTRKNGPKGFGWYFNTATYENAPLTTFEKKVWFEKWCGFLGNDIFEMLADQTLEEQWSFGNRTDFGILRNYLRYTFSHQFINKDIGYSADGRYAAFNTGLPDRNTYKHLYALFEKNEELEGKALHPLYFRQEYVFKEFVIPGRGGNGKVLSGNIRPLPNPPQYFKARSETVWELDFNDSNQVTIPEYDDTHILIQRCERIPLNFYRFPSAQSPKLTKILNSDESPAEKYKQIKEYFKPIMDNEPDREVTFVYRTLTDSLESVISTAVRKLSWNWRAVVPCFNPERNEPCFLLPVSFCDPVKPDRAMIASVNKIEDDYIYTIHTVIPLDWAYLDARLVCRPESEWLAANYIGEDED